jgi:PAS domain S-box-containing protein
MRYVMANPAYRAIRADPEAPIAGRTIAEVFSPEVARIIEPFVQQVIQSGEVLNIAEYEAPIRGRTWWNLREIPLCDETGEVEAVLILTEDVTERKQAEEALQRRSEELQASQARMAAANKELEAFAYSVSHDLRAPLRGMDAFSRILLEKHSSQLPEEALHCLQMVRDNAQQMGRLIDDLLAFSRLSQQPLKKEPVDHKALVFGAIESLKDGHQGRRIELSVGELAASEADPRLIRQVWINLIGNALKYTRSRDPAVVSVGSEIQEGVPVYHVRDNGVGFDMRYAHKLFNVFQRLHRAEDYEGTGVGLAIVQRVIDRHGGRVWAQGAKNQGATFYFTLQ